MQLCVATTCVPGDLFRKLEKIAGAGFTGIELYEPNLTESDAPVREIGEFIKSLGLTADVVQPFLDFEGLSGAARLRAFERLDRKLDLLEELEARTLLIGTSVHPDAAGDSQAIRDDFAELAARSGARGCRAALIALPWARHVTTEMQVLEIVEAVDSPHLGLALNAAFSLADGSRPARLRDLPGRRLFHVQLSDALAAELDVSRLRSQPGQLPGLGNLNLAGFTRVIARTGYDGPWSLSRISGAAEDSREGYARDGFRALVSLLDEVALTEPALPRPLSDLPPRVYPKGIEFIEFAVDERAHQALADTLASLCFRKERRHVAKRVELWRQGAINLVLNSEGKGFAAEAFAEHGPSVCDMGLRVSDADQTVERATRLGATMFSQPVGAGELAIPAIKGVGGNVVHFIDEKSDLHRVWDIEFQPVPKAEAIPPAGLRRIDHVAQTMRHQEMRSWLTFYTSTFALEKERMIDVADPSGVILSQALASPEGEVRLNLNGAGERRTFAGSFLADQSGAGVQHIAFQSDDIFETSDHLEAAGFDRLRVPDNYYDDLATRFALPPDMLARLRAGHILYDQVDDAAYFQIYSAPIFRGFFFEIVQRVDGYQGYGARNAPIRLAAQMRRMHGEPTQ